MIRYTHFLTFLVLLLAPGAVWGQGFLEQNRTTIELSTNYPEPGEAIEATVLNQNSSGLPGDLVWSVNGQINPSFTNERTIELSASGLGSPTVIQVLKNGTTLARSVVNPVYLDIHVDPLTYTPEHYSGRAEVTPGAEVLLTALVEEVVKRNPSAYTYTWEINGQVIEGGAWNGNYRVRVPVPIGRNTMDVRVSVTRAGLGKIGEERIEVPIRDTETLFYEVSTLYGLDHIALGNEHTLLENNITVRAIPYFLANEAIQRSNFAEWRLNNRTLDPQSPFTVTLQPNRTQGQSTVSFRHYNPDNFTQQANGSLRINY